MGQNVEHHHAPILLAHLLNEERERNAALHERYCAALEDLPKGRVYLRRVERRDGDANAYAYLSRRVPGKKQPESKYVGRAGSDEVDKLQKRIADRDRLRRQIKVLKIERKMIEKALAEYQRLR